MLNLIHCFIMLKLIFVVLLSTLHASALLKINVRNQGGELIEETLSGNVTEDYTTLEFIKPDGTIISHLVDFKNEVQIFQTLILGEEERGQNQYQVMCFITKVDKGDYIASDAIAKLRQKNPHAERQAEDELPELDYQMEVLVHLNRSAAISPHIGQLCAEAAGATFSRHQDIQHVAAHRAHTPTFECHREGENGTEMLVDACYNGTTAHCDKIEFRHSYTSVVTEWSLVCDRASEAHALQSLFMAGNALACLPIGPLADTFGRRKTVLLMFGVQAALVGGLALSPNYGTFATLRFLAGFLQAGGFPSFTLATELVGPQMRSKVGMLGSVFFSSGILLLALAAYIITDWRWLLGFSALVAALSVLLIGVVVPRSARWLLQKGRTQEAQQALLGMARSNGLPPPADFSLVPAKQETGQTSDSCFTLFRRGRAALWTLVLCFNWAVHTLSYYGLTAAAAGMGHGRFSSFALSGLVEMPPVLFITWILERLGRRYTLSGTMAIGGIGCVLIFVLPAAYIDDHGGRLTLSLIGKLCISTTFTVTYIFTSEIFPTSIRNTGLGIVNISARLAGIVYPFVALLNGVSKDSHFLLFGLLITSSALLDLLLPETLGKTLPKNVDEMLGHDIEKYSPLKLDDESDSDLELEASFEKDLELKQI